MTQYPVPYISPSTRPGRIAVAVLWLVVALCLGRIATASGDYQWDFRVFHAAPAALDSGSNPYDKMAQLAIPEHLSYLYPPIALYAFRPFSALPFEIAYLCWFSFKLLALALLLRLWHRHFEPLDSSVLVLAFLTFGFNAAILRDMTAGNIAILEQLGLWTAFYLIVKGRSYSAAAIIALVAQFKLMPVVFLGLLPFVGPARGWKPLLAGGGIFAGVFSLNFLLMPQMMSHYLESFGAVNPNLDERGEINPSTLALLRDIVDVVSKSGVATPPWLADAAFLIFVTGLAIVLLWALRKYATRIASMDPRWLIYIGCLLYVLTMPRVKDYTYMILLIPALFALRRVACGPVVPALILLLFLPPADSYVPGFGSFLPWLQSYVPWIAACCLLYFTIDWLAKSVPHDKRI